MPGRIAAPHRRQSLTLPVVITLALGLVALAGCGSSTSPPSAGPPTSAADSSATTPAPTAPPGATEGTLPAGTATIDQATLPVGTVLVDGTGFVLYALTTDNGGAAPCVDACATAWPPLIGTGIGVAEGVPLTPGKFTLVKRPDGTTQVAANGHPLYRYAGDTQQGQAGGQGVGGVWFVVGADGNPIKG